MACVPSGIPEVVVASYGLAMAKRDITELAHSVNWMLVVFDEAHTLRKSETRTYQVRCVRLVPPCRPTPSYRA